MIAFKERGEHALTCRVLLSTYVRAKEESFVCIIIIIVVVVVVIIYPVNQSHYQDNSGFFSSDENFVVT